MCRERFGLGEEHRSTRGGAPAKQRLPIEGASSLEKCSDATAAGHSIGCEETDFQDSVLTCAVVLAGTGCREVGRETRPTQKDPNFVPDSSYKM